MLLSFVIAFYRFWYGSLRLRGAGFLLRMCARFLPESEHYPLKVANIGQIAVNLRDASGIAWLNYTLGKIGIEDRLISVIVRLASKRPLIWDVGANSGFFAAALVERLTDYAEMHLFEPNPKLMPTLQQLASLLPNVHATNLALSDKSEVLTLYVPKADSSMASFTPRPGARPVNVQCTTVDAFLKDSGSGDPDIVIIDTEGNDCRVINGMAELIDRKRPLIFFENIFQTAEAIRSTLPEDYRHFTVDDKSGELVPGLDKTRGHNSAFLPQS